MGRKTCAMFLGRRNEASSCRLLEVEDVRLTDTYSLKRRLGEDVGCALALRLHGSKALDPRYPAGLRN